MTLASGGIPRLMACAYCQRIAEFFSSQMGDGEDRALAKGKRKSRSLDTLRHPCRMAHNAARDDKGGGDSGEPEVNNAPMAKMAG